MKLKCTLLVLTVSVAAVADLPPWHEREAAYRVVTRWNAGDCSGSRRRQWDNMVDAWYDAITTGHGAENWQRSGFQVNGDIADSDFVDPDIVFWGRDWWRGHVDEVDVMMVGMHGSEYSDPKRWYGKVRVNEPGDGNCNAFQGHMDLDFDAEFLHLSSCHSMCDDNRALWRSSYHHVHSITGFHGIMYIGSNLVDEYDDFGDDAFEMAIATAWLDEHYKRRIAYRCASRFLGICTSYFHSQQCPVAQAAGTSPADARNHRGTEQYDDVLSHPWDRTNFASTWISGCDPRRDPAQP